MHRIITSTVLLALLASCAASHSPEYDKTKLRVAEGRIEQLESDLATARNVLRDQITRIETLQKKSLECQAQTASAYSNDTIHEWANSTVNNYWSKDPSGSYDLCYLHAVKDKQTGEPTEGMYLDVTKYPDEVINACAVITHGQEW